VELPEIAWNPVSRTAFYAWLAVYCVLLLFLARNSGHMTPLDNVHLPIHEGGHLLFGYLGNQKLMVWGGTILQLLVPLLLAYSFIARAELLGTVFCLVAFFHSVLDVSIYMADAIVQELPLVTVGGDGSEVEHDWAYIFRHLGVFPHAVGIAQCVRTLAWCGIAATMAWFIWRYRSQEEALMSAVGAGL
jgi:hypothetical protein